MEPEYKQIEIDGVPVPYLIYSDGRVFSIRANRFMSDNSIRKGYRFVIICDAKNNIRTYRTIHRLVATAFIPNPLNLPSVNHKDGNKLNNCVENLEWCTPSQNTRHAFEHGLMKPQYGSDNHFTKLTEDIVIRICELLNDGYTSKVISEMLGVSLHQIANIRCGLAWKHISSRYKNIHKCVPKFKKFHKFIDSMIIQGNTNSEIYEILLSLSGLTETEMYNLVNGRRLILTKRGVI